MKITPETVKAEQWCCETMGTYVLKIGFWVDFKEPAMVVDLHISDWLEGGTEIIQFFPSAGRDWR